MAIQKPRGTQDFLPERMREWKYVEEKIASLCSAYGFGEIRTPVFENTSLFLRGIGETTDVVQKEMYTFASGDKGDTFTLRPENTASAVRAYLEHKIYGTENMTKWFYIGPMFRHERPQAGRYRQFHQFGAEVLGSSSPYTDSEVISLALEVCKSVGLTGLTLELNSVGCPKCRPVYREALIQYFEPHKEELCTDCQSRLTKNPLRVLDCKVDTDKTKEAPRITEYLCEECEEHFKKVQELLTAIGISYTLNPNLVRGLDYYTKTAFEIKYPPLGAQSAVAGGGRYDGLVEELDGPSTPAIGFAIGMERLLLAIEKQEAMPQFAPLKSVFVVSMGDEASVEGFRLVTSLRKRDIYAAMDGAGRSMKSQLKLANRMRAEYAIIIGEEELANGKVLVRNMAEGTQEEVMLDAVLDYVEHVMKG